MARRYSTDPSKSPFRFLYAPKCEGLNVGDYRPKKKRSRIFVLLLQISQRSGLRKKMRSRNNKPTMRRVEQIKAKILAVLTPGITLPGESIYGEMQTSVEFSEFWYTVERMEQAGLIEAGGREYGSVGRQTIQRKVNR